MIITRTPFRISFVGGGTDLKSYYQTGYGAVVSATIDKYMYITVNKRFDDSIRVSYSSTEIVDRVEDIKHDIVREALKMVGIDHGIEITSVSDIPAGTGLGSSSSFAVGLLNALYTYIGQQRSAHERNQGTLAAEIRQRNTDDCHCPDRPCHDPVSRGEQRVIFLPYGNGHKCKRSQCHNPSGQEEQYHRHHDQQRGGQADHVVGDDEDDTCRTDADMMLLLCQSKFTCKGSG